MELAPLSAGFQSLPQPLTIKLGPSGAASQVGGFVREAGSFFRCHLNPQGVFNQWFEASFPRAGALGCMVCFAPLLFLLVYPCAIVGLQGLPAHLVGSASCSLACPITQSAASLGVPAATWLQVLSTPAARLRPSYRSG